MPKLELFYPVKPVRINQAFGIYNPAYEQFGFTHHNGIDYATVADQTAYAMCDGIVSEVGTQKGAGNFVRYRTVGKVEVQGRLEWVEFMYMHAAKVLVKKGDIVKAGDPLIICDSTGFSTGNHLHISAYYLTPLGAKARVGWEGTNWCFDFSRYYNNFFAEDAQKVFSLYYQIIALLRSYLKP